MKGTTMLKRLGAALLALMVISTWTLSAAAEDAATEDAATEEAATEAAAPAAPEVGDDKIGYAIGHMMGKNLASSGLEFDLEQLLLGLKDVLLKNDSAMSDEEIRAALDSFQKKAQLAAEEKMKTEGKANLEKGEAFLAENKGKEGVITTESGLQYQVLQEGTGESPLATSKVKVHYTGKLLDDTVFDSSVERGVPAEFPLNRVISGWTEGLQLMKVGAKYRLWIPAALAYGPNPDPRSGIGPNETLTFDVELLEIMDKENASDAIVIPNTAGN